MKMFVKPVYINLNFYLIQILISLFTIKLISPRITFLTFLIFSIFFLNWNFFINVLFLNQKIQCIYLIYLTFFSNKPYVQVVWLTLRFGGENTSCPLCVLATYPSCGALTIRQAYCTIYSTRCKIFFPYLKLDVDFLPRVFQNYPSFLMFAQISFVFITFGTYLFIILSFYPDLPPFFPLFLFFSPFTVPIRLNWVEYIPLPPGGEVGGQGGGEQDR